MAKPPQSTHSSVTQMLCDIDIQFSIQPGGVYPEHPDSSPSPDSLSSEHDTPATSLYRIYELFLIDRNTQFRNELEYFCRQPPYWPVSSIPDLQDPDPEQYAVLAVLAHFMCLAFTIIGRSNLHIRMQSRSEMESRG